MFVIKEMFVVGYDNVALHFVVVDILLIRNIQESSVKQTERCDKSIII